ncbi:hypothetical protein KA050_03415 [Candidatus Gracilibacteria bacterium]|nr:hypothetical protein [Candidatus Gracilibacteria bacterium]
MTFIPPGEKIIETKICRLSGKEFVVTDKDIELLDKISPVFGGQKYSLPTPTLSPEERQRRRLSFRNERKMYKRKCDKSGQEIISLYSPDKPYVVYDQKVWWGDDWNAYEYGKSIDFERPFFEQMNELILVTPKVSILNTLCENSEYTNHTLQSKNCYLCVGTTKCENCYYSNFIKECKNIIDSTFCTESELIYYGMDVTRCYNCLYVKNSVNCRDCFGIEECEQCTNCIGCYGLKNKQFHVFNQPVSSEDFKKIWNKALSQSGCAKILADLKNLREKQHIRNMHLINCENCYGDQLENGKHGFMCFDAKNIENARYTYFSPKNINCIDCTYTAPEGIEYCGEVGSTVGVSNAFSTFHYWYGTHGYYLHACQNSDHLFGCASIKKGKYSLLNTSYSVQEYEHLCKKVIAHMISTGEWGEHFPTELSPFGYNETVAQEYFPLSENETKEQGWKWYDGENKNTYIGAYYTPLPINQYDEKNVGYEPAQKNIDELLSGILECEVSKKPFKIIKQELAFYIENNLPLPTKHPDQRHKERMSLRNPRELHERICPECQKIMITTYRPDRPEKVVCEECYRKLVY